MNLKYWLLPAIVMFAFGCSHNPTQDEERGESFALNDRNPAAETVGGETDDVTAIKDSTPADPTSIVASSRTVQIVGSRPRGGCNNTLAYVKAVLRSGGFEVPVHTGNAGDSVNAWTNAGYKQLSPTERTKEYDICVYRGREPGTIMVKKGEQWADGCMKYTGVWQTYSHYRLAGCFRPTKANH